MVYRALDIEAQRCVLESMESAGTRHRTAYRLCREYAECLAIVVSQDGAVKFLANRQEANCALASRHGMALRPAAGHGWQRYAKPQMKRCGASNKRNTLR